MTAESEPPALLETPPQQPRGSALVHAGSARRPLTHLRGSAAIATRRNAAGAAEKWVKPEVDPPKRIALPRGIVAAVYDCRIGGLSGAPRDAATATVRQRAIRGNSLYSSLKNPHRSSNGVVFPCQKRSFIFAAMQSDWHGRDGHAPFFCSAKSHFKRDIRINRRFRDSTALARCENPWPARPPTRSLRPATPRVKPLREGRGRAGE